MTERELLRELFEWVRGYALDDVPNVRYYLTGGAEIMLRVEKHLDAPPAGDSGHE